MEEFLGNPIECEKIIASPLLNHSFKANQCIKNAMIAAKCTGDRVVEGILLTLENNIVVSAVVHCWNKREDSYYDVTKDYVWNSEEWKIQNIKSFSPNSTISYKYFACKDYNVADHDMDSFKMSYVYLLDYFKGKLL